jgi:hypothetical protein
MMTISNGCAMLTIQTTQPIQQASPTVSSRNNSPTTTATQTFTLIPTLTSTYTHTPTLTPTSTITYIPTLPTEEARLRLLDLIANNGNCRLPCFWGITPGTSTSIDAQKILNPLSSISGFTDFTDLLNSGSGTGAIQPIYNDGKLTISISIGFITYPENNIVRSISIYTEAYNSVSDPSNPGFIFNSMVFGRQLAFYMLPHILSEYGRPSSVLLHSLPGPNERGEMGLFYLALFYPNQGFVVHYTTMARMSGSNILGCMANAHVTLDVYPSEQSDNFYGQLPDAYSDIALVSYKPLEEVTSMSLDQFYQTFNKPTDQCIVTASANWPEPER